MYNSKTPFTGTRPVSTDQRAHVHAMLEELSDVMLTTFAHGGANPIACARPMHITHLDHDDSIWIMTSIDSESVAELLAMRGCTIVAQSATRYVSIVGVGTIVTERGRVRAMWKKLHEVWFPDGPEDPKVCLIHFAPTQAEFWDMSSTNGLKYVYEAAKALVTGQRPKPDSRQHGIVKM